MVNVKLIKDKIKGTPVGYGFVEFPDANTAREIFQTLNGQAIPGSNRVFKLNWASHGGGVARATGGAAPGGGQREPQQSYGAAPGGGDYQVYVGDLDAAVTNPMLLQTFKQIYPSVHEAKVICDPVTRASKGYGFIKFGNKEESERALQEMQGKQILGRPIKMNYASQRNKTQQETNRYAGGGAPQGGAGGFGAGQ